MRGQLDSRVPAAQELAARTLVMFDGEKRIEAHKNTYKRIRSQVAAAIFDDSNVGQKRFHEYLDREGEIWCAAPPLRLVLD